MGFETATGKGPEKVEKSQLDFISEGWGVEDILT